MKLYLIQHAEAAEKDVDVERHLTAGGIRDVETVGIFLERLTPDVPLVLHSSKTRARETAERIAKHIGPQATVEEAEGLCPNDDPAPWLQRLRAYDHDVALIGHMPFLSRLASLLLTGQEDEHMIGFEKSTVACFVCDEIRCWRLAWMVPPELVAR
jgi:phosphohistidine phosphatase